MKHASLAAHYRPQTFAEVTGQHMITTVLSRAAAEDRMAAAYLLSGTRGVGKTTIARILAKALNCVHAPTAEPCNECANCQMITKGNHVDVTEIDGASNNSVEDARALRENIGYAPMEGRYKVFIIDEAHMLSRSAFNALLKTLEEPPPRVVFVFATTEVHKFPITIVSRCQHFIFKRLSEDGLVAHLSRVLGLEGIEFDPQAVRTIARRANGSVRDGMSLLGQTLALGESTLSMESTRAVLGLAGQELFMTLMEAIAREDCPAVMELMHKLSDQGIDMGFFLRELISLWRTLFLLREAGQNIIPSLQISTEESSHLLTLAAKFSAAHLHAAWHMTLDAQRKVIHSPEPAAALELLLINLTLMPRLLPLQAAPLPDANTPMQAPQQQAPQQAQQVTPPPSPPWAEEEKKNSPELKAEVNLGNTGELGNLGQQQVQRYGQKASAQHKRSEPATSYAPQGKPSYSSPHLSNTPEAPPLEDADFSSEEPPAYLWEGEVAHGAYENEIGENGAYGNEAYAEEAHSPKVMQEPSFIDKPHAMPAAAPQGAQKITCTWQDVVAHLSQLEPPVVSSIFLLQATGFFEGNTLHINTKSLAVFQGIERVRPALQETLEAFCGQGILVQVHRDEQVFKPVNSLVQEFSAKEELKDCLEILDASIYKVRPLNENT